MWLIEKGVSIVLILVCILLGVALMTVAERKYMSSIQRRRGPNVIGYYGLGQAFSDGLKLVMKEGLKPTSANSVLYRLAPIVSFGVGLVGWSVIPLSEGLVHSDVNIGILFIMCVGGIGVYGVLLAGWASNSKYALLGGLRSAAQMISYEVSIGFTLVAVIVWSGTMNLTEIVLSQERMWNMVGLVPVYGIFMISMIAETNRHPFDLPEAEAELVSGYNVEYSGSGFALFFLGEYCSIIMMSSLSVILFNGGWLWPGLDVKWLGASIMGVKVFLVICALIWIRAAYPRYRYDQLMEIGWKSLLPVSLGSVLLVSGVLYGME